MLLMLHSDRPNIAQLHSTAASTILSEKVDNIPMEALQYPTLRWTGEQAHFVSSPYDVPLAGIGSGAHLT